MKAIKFLLLTGFCMLGAGTALHNTGLKVAGLVSCVVLLCAYFVVRSGHARLHNAQMAARQGMTADLLILEYHDLLNAHIAVFVGNGKSKEQIAAMAMNETMAALMKKYGYTTDELGGMLFGGL